MADVDPSASIFLETVGKAPHGQRLKGRKILVVGGGQRDQPPDVEHSIGNGRAMSVLFAREVSNPSEYMHPPWCSKSGATYYR